MIGEGDLVESKIAERAARQARLERLLGNPDFKVWLEGELDEFCAFEQGYGHVDEFRQGIRAAGSHLMHSFDGVRGADEFLGAMFARRFNRKGQ